MFKGQGMEFAEVREYQPGDEVRTIDWNVSARMGRPFVKRYVEERELTVMLVVDRSASEGFGTTGRTKRDVLTEIGAVLALAAARNNDRVGLVLFTDRVEHVVPPRKGRRHVLRLLRDLFVLEPVGRATDVGAPCDLLTQLLGHRSAIFVLSDFLSRPFEKPLSRLVRRHDVVAVQVADPAERTLPDVGWARVADPETGEQVDVDTSDPRVRAAFTEVVQREAEQVRQLFARYGVDTVDVTTDQEWVTPLRGFFRQREQKKAKG
ncbi:MAG: DUF58 domain-containing protein [Gemmatimonadaceae bacterium]|nr:DUF58 domain-containing protein [Gemmatimonadaceae bacterium]